MDEGAQQRIVSLDLTGEQFVRGFGRLVQGERERSNLKNSNNERMKSSDERENIVNHGWTPLNRDGEKTLNREQRERRLAAKEHIERKVKRSLEPISGVERELPGGGLEPGASGKRCSGRWVQLGKGGQKVGKRTCFSHFETVLARLFPHKSTQVVDVPHKATARFFWGRPEMVLATDETLIKHRWG